MTNKYIILISIAFLSSCSQTDELEKRLYLDPITHEELLFSKRIVNNWDIYSLEDKDILIIEREGKAKVFLIGFDDGTNQVSVFSHAYGSPVVDLRDNSGDYIFNEIEYRTDQFEAIDKNFDGQIDIRADWNRNKTKIWYHDSWYDLNTDDKGQYINVEGVRKNMKFENGSFKEQI